MSIKTTTRSPTGLCLIAIGLIRVLLPQPAAAAPPATPVQGSDFEAFQMYVGDPLRGLEEDDAGSLFESGADTAHVRSLAAVSTNPQQELELHCPSAR